MDENDLDVDEDEFEELNESDVEEVFVDELLGAECDIDSENEPLETEDRSSPIRDDADYVFKKHTGPVFCCALEPKNGNLAVTGGQDDMAYVWEIQQGQVLFECHGHTDSVTIASFSYDGTYVATADMNSLVQVWKVATKELTWSESVDDLCWLRWHQGMNALLCGTKSGEVFLWKIPSGVCRVIPGHGLMTDSSVIMPDGRRIVVGDSDGSVRLLELKSGQMLGKLVQGEAHSTAISCMDTHTDNNMIATGGGDGRVSLFKTQPLKVVWTFECPSEGGDSPPYVEALGFCKDPTMTLMAAGTLSGNLYILDFSRQMLRHQCLLEAGISRVLWDHHGTTVFVGSLDGVVRLYDGRSGSLTTQLLGHREAILDISLSIILSILSFVVEPYILTQNDM